jgi:hypothetical protein
MLTNETITFGKYKGMTLGRVLRDRSYCKWLLEQEWFLTNYEWLYNRIKNYNPKTYFLNPNRGDPNDFIDSYVYFNLTPVEELKIELSTVDKTCYNYYLRMTREIRGRIYQRLENEEENPYDIKAPTSWLKRFERECGIPRNDFKEFMEAYELPNIPYVIERIKKEGGIEYKGAQSFKIAKARSEAQEKWWEEVLKEKYGEDLGTQFKYMNCIFDMINISTKTIFECKLGLKDFDEAQHNKYKVALKEYRIIYLIAKECVIEMERSCIYTTNPDKYQLYLLNVPTMKNPSYLDELIKEFDVVEIEDLSTLFGKSSGDLK